MRSNVKKAEYGDFQTPEVLAREVCVTLREQGLQPAVLLEPTCGLGNFLVAGLDQFPGVQQALGADINPKYICKVESRLRGQPDAKKVRVVEADFFATDWAKVISELPEPVLVLGNLPWVTNAHLSTLGSQNLPTKSNFQKRNGLDAITGKANFDISEWMLIRLLEAMNGRRGTLAMLCKSSVARKTLFHGWKNAIAIERSVIYRIEADLHFDAAVDAALLVTHFRPGARDLEANVCSHLKNTSPETVIGFEDGMLLSDLTAYHRLKHLCGEEIIKWRSGIKHDCSKVMELSREGAKYRNGLGELVDLEDTYLFPMMKSSHVARRIGDNSRYMLVTQRAIGQNTAEIHEQAPRTWVYLNAHAGQLNKRGSSIYRNRPPFSIFGVGDYTFAPWKVAISGFYKKLAFTTIGPVGGKPVVFDDTSYFLPCKTSAQAEYLGSLLNSSTAQAFYKAFVFWDAKRPITADLLKRLNLRRLALEDGSADQFDRQFGKVEAAMTASLFDYLSDYES
jgi:hypothetical protein